jgi:hypothetical protein
MGCRISATRWPMAPEPTMTSRYRHQPRTFTTDNDGKGVNWHFAALGSINHANPRSARYVRKHLHAPVGGRTISKRCQNRQVQWPLPARRIQRAADTTGLDSPSAQSLPANMQRRCSRPSSGTSVSAILDMCGVPGMVFQIMSRSTYVGAGDGVFLEDAPDELAVFLLQRFGGRGEGGGPPRSESFLLLTPEFFGDVETADTPASRLHSRLGEMCNRGALLAHTDRHHIQNPGAGYRWEFWSSLGGNGSL